MTRDEVMALMDDELRIKAAELAGRKGGEHFCADEPSDVCPCLEGTEDVSDCTYLDGGGCWEDCAQKFSSPPPDYPHDIAAALELLEHAKDLDAREWRGRTLIIARWFSDQSSCKDWETSPGWEVRSILFDRVTPVEITRAFVFALTQDES